MNRSRRLPEIEYLRAIAVLAVILHHLGVAPGGFAGVDIFFVISGFVISQALHDAECQGWLPCLKQFYYRRIIRIIPPLMLVSCVSAAMAWWLFFVTEFERLQDALVHQSILLQNAFFAGAVTDYFRALPSTDVTLHTWSLAVEEQFYLVFPLFFILLFRRRKGWRRPGVVLAAVTIGATGLSIVADGALERATVSALRAYLDAPVDEQAARFYASTFRGWEFLLGACAFAIRERFRPGCPAAVSGLGAHASFAVGLVGLSGAVFVPLAADTWPNGQTLALTTLAAVSLALTAPSVSHATPRGLPARVLEYIGNTSYSAYLWHWPLLGYFAYTNFDFGAAPYDYLLYAAVLAVLVAATYHLVEKRRFAISRRGSVALLASFVGGMVLLGMLDRDMTPFSGPRRMIEETSRYDQSPCQYEHIQDVNGPFVVLFGESHAQMLRSEFTRAANRHGIGVHCIDGSRARLSSERAATLERFSPALESPWYAGTFLAMRWNMYAVGFPSYEVEEDGDRYLEWDGQDPRDGAEALSFFARNMEALLAGIATIRPGRPLGVMLQVPQMPFFPPKEAVVDYYGLRFRTLPIKLASQQQEENGPVQSVFADISQRVPEVAVLDPVPLLCAGPECPYREGWRVLYRDDDHVSVYGAGKLAPLFDEWFGRLALGETRREALGPASTDQRD